MNKLNIPTGKINAVSNSQFDFLNPRSLAEIVKGTNKSIDHNFCLNNKRSTLREAAVLVSKLSNIKLRVLSTETGLQFYTGHHLLDTPPGYSYLPYTPFSGLCLEPQGWPDAPNKENFPSVFLSLKNSIPFLLGLVMLGMGMTIDFSDLKRRKSI